MIPFRYRLHALDLWHGTPFRYRLHALDLWHGIRLGTLGIQHRLRAHLKEQNRQWPKEKIYTQGYFYQGLEESGITGVKPTEFRFRQYEVDDIIKDADVLDIGSNSGFVAIYCARRASSVVGVELNPFLNRIANDSAAYLGIRNLEIVESDFIEFQTEKKFDVILSLSNHHTVDRGEQLATAQIG